MQYDFQRALIEEQKIDFLLKFRKFRVLAVSIDDVQNKIRGVTPQQWARAEGMMRYFLQARRRYNSTCVLEAKTVVLDENAEDLLAIHRYCVEELGCDHHSFQFLKGSPIQHADYMFSYDEIFKKSHAPVYKKFDIIKDQLEKIRAYNLRNGKAAFLHPSVGSLVSNEPLPDLNYLNASEHVRQNYLPCKFPWSSVHVNVDGNLFPCMAVAMGNVKTTSLPEIIHGNDFKRFKDLIRKEGSVEACNRCGWLRPQPSKRYV